jgi:hypothetical protein
MKKNHPLALLQRRGIRSIKFEVDKNKANQFPPLEGLGVVNLKHKLFNQHRY